MKKILFLISVVVFGFSYITMAAPATPVYLNTYEGGGPYIAPDPLDGPYPDGAPYSLVANGTGNDNYGNMNTVDDYWIINDLALAQLFSSDKFEFPDDLESDPDGWEVNKDDPDNTFLVDPANATTTGTWRYYSGQLTDDQSDNDFELFFSIKTAQKWNLFAMNSDWYNDSNIVQAVVWSTLDDFFETSEDDLGGNDISHISFWRRPQIPDSVVPEPATMILFGFGLIGIAGALKKIRKN